MNFSFVTCAALFMLFTAASCAPAVPQDACAAVQHSSLELNRIAKAVSVKARNGSKDVINFNISPEWMESRDKCAPGTLRHESVHCTRKILLVLESYLSAVNDVAEFNSCSVFASEVKPVMRKLQKDMSRCVGSKGGMHHEQSHNKEKSSESSGSSARWKEALLCQYTMDRLFSFSILTARVFAVGDPAHHAEGSAQICKQKH